MAERRAQALALDRDLLRELLGQEELRDLLDADAVEQVEDELRGDPRSPDELHDLLLRRGDLRPGEYDEAHAAPLLAERRAITVRVAGEDRLVAAEDAGRYRDALGAMPPAGLPDAFLEAGEDPLASLLVRFARGRGPFTTAEAAARFALSWTAPRRLWRRSSETTASCAASSVRAGRSANGATPTSCAASAAPALRASGSRWSRPSSTRSPASSRPGRGSTAARRSARRSCRCRASPLPVALWESDVLPAPRARLPPRAARPALRLGGGRLGRRRASNASRSSSARTRRRSAGRPRFPRPRARRPMRSVRRSSGARSSGTTSSTRPGSSRRSVLPALWELVWSGEVTNDAWQPLRAGRRFQAPRPQRRPRRFSRQRSDAITATQGRWSTTARLFAGEPEPRALAELLLERQGIVTRDGVRGEGVPGRLRPRLPGAPEARDAGRLPPRLLRRGPRRSPVRAARRRRAAARERRAGRAARPRRRRPGPALRRRDPVAQTGRRARGSRRRRARRSPGRRGGALRRAGRPFPRSPQGPRR